MNMSPHLRDDLAVFLFILQLGRVYWNQSVAVGYGFITSFVESGQVTGLGKNRFCYNFEHAALDAAVKGASTGVLLHYVES